MNTVKTDGIRNRSGVAVKNAAKSENKWLQLNGAAVVAIRDCNCVNHRLLCARFTPCKGTGAYQRDPRAGKFRLRICVHPCSKLVNSRKSHLPWTACSPGSVSSSDGKRHRSCEKTELEVCSLTRFMPLSRAEIMTMRVGVNARQQFLQTRLQEGKKGQNWYQIVFNEEGIWWVTDNLAFSFPVLLLFRGLVAGALWSVYQLAHLRLSETVTGAAWSMCPGQLDFSRLREVTPRLLFSLAALVGESTCRNLVRQCEWRCILSPKSRVLGISFFSYQEKFYLHTQLIGWVTYILLSYIDYTRDM